MSLLFAFTMGNIGELGRGFIDDLTQAEMNYVSNAFLGGIIFNAANILIAAAISIAVGKAGFAISYGLGQGATLVAALWGVFIWKEFKQAKGTTGLLATMFAFFVVGLCLQIYGI